MKSLRHPLYEGCICAQAIRTKSTQHQHNTWLCARLLKEEFNQRIKSEIHHLVFVNGKSLKKKRFPFPKHLGRNESATKWTRISFWFSFFSFFLVLPAFLDTGSTNGTHRSHARCHPYQIPQPVKVGHTTGIYVPYSFRTVVWILLYPT